MSEPATLPEDTLTLPLPVRLVLPALSRVANDTLALDPDAVQYLDRLDGKRVRMVFGKIASLDLVFIDRKIEMLEAGATAADLRVAGELHALASLMNGNDAIYRGQASIDGDMGLADAFKGLLKHFEPDWQSRVSPWLGDTLTHQIERALGDARRWGQRTREHLALDTRDYLQDESALLATPSRVKNRGEVIDTLLVDIERLAKRIERLERERSD